MNMKTLAILVIVTISLSLSSGCTGEKDLGTLLEEEGEYWGFLSQEGISGNEAKELTHIYVTLVEKGDENPVDALIKMRDEVKDKNLGGTVDFLNSRGFTDEETALMAMPLTSSDANWNKYVGSMVAIDDYVNNRLGYRGIPPRS